MEAFNVEMQMSKLVWRLRPAFGCDRCLPTPILQTFLALAFVYRVFWVSSVSALAADVPAIDMSDHRSELKVLNTVWTSNDLAHLDLQS